MIVFSDKNQWRKQGVLIISVVAKISSSQNATFSRHFQEEKYRTITVTVNFFHFRRFSSFETIHPCLRGRPILLFIKRFAREGQILQNTKMYPLRRFPALWDKVTKMIFPLYKAKIFACYILYRKLYQKSIDFAPKLFRDNPLKYSNESTGSGFESQHNVCFLTFYAKKYTTVIFFKHQNQLCPMSILSYSTGTTPGHSFLF